jgi:hypothetical protein
MEQKSNPEAKYSPRHLAAVAFSILLLTSLFAVIGSNAIVASAEESNDTQVITSELTDPNKVVAASGSNRFVVWQDHTTGNDDIMFKRSTDNGATWKTTVNLSSNAGDSSDPKLVVQSSNVYVVWVQANSAGDKFDIYFRRSSDNGATWGAKVNVSTNGKSGFNALAVSGSYVYIAFPSGDDLLFRRSSNSGESFGSINPLSSNFNGALTIATSGSHVYVGWESSSLEPVVRHSSNNGGTWDSPSELPSYQYGLDSFALGATGPYVYAVWQEVIGCEEETELLFSRSIDNGATWADDVTLAGCGGEGGNFVDYLVMAISGNKIFVLYSDQGDINIIRSTDNGASWNSRNNLSNNPGSSLFSGIAVQGSNVYVLWTQLNTDRTLADIFLKRSSDSGATWKSSKNISNNAGWSEHGLIAISGSNVYVAWEDTTGGDLDILFRRSTDRGATLKSTISISNNDGTSTGPRMLVTGTSIFIVWTDDTPGNNDILHRRSPDNGATWKTTQNLSNNGGTSQTPQIQG